VGNGTVFEITPGGTLTTLLSFCATGGCPSKCADGDNPKAGLVPDPDGNFYGTTNNGGPNQGGGGGTFCEYGCGTIFKITPGRTETILYDFCNLTDCGDGAAPYARLLRGPDGNFYGTTAFGGAHGDGTIFRVTPSGVLTTLYSLCSQSRCTDGEFPYAGLAQAIDGDFYGTTYSGGATGVGTVFKITPSGTLTTLYSFCTRTACTDGKNPYAGLVRGTDGEFYGTTSQGEGYTHGTIFKITPTGTLTTLYTFCSQQYVRTATTPARGWSRPPTGTSTGQPSLAVPLTAMEAVERSSACLLVCRGL